jgi:nucleoside-diphosphate-sugar epimerase
MSGRALVTGATGMLGSYIVERLLEDGWAVRALVRSRDRGAWVEERGATLVEGRLEDLDSLIAATRSCDAVFNAGAAIGAGGVWEHYRRVNVVGARSVVEAAGRAGARLVHVSSTAVHGNARYFDEPTDERTPLPDLPDHDVYGRSKQESEGIVLRAHAQGRIWSSVVRPPVMYGLRDRQFAPRLGPVLERGVFPRIAGGGTTLPIVHARHVAEGAVLAATHDVAAGQAYLLTNDFPVTVNDLIRYAEAGLGRKIRAPSVPLLLGRFGFVVLAVALTLAGRSDLARHATGTLHMLTRDNPFTSERARAELGWSPSLSPEIGLTEALRAWKARREATQGTAGEPEPAAK